MHRKGIAHRDIRPANIWYSDKKKGFILGGLGNAIMLDKIKITPQVGYNLAGVPYYMPKYLLRIGKKEDFS